MNMKPLRKLSLSTLVLLSLCSISSLVSAAEVLITRNFSGVWDQPDHQSQGFILQIAADADAEKIGVVYWFTYDDDLTPAWYLAVGPVVGAQIPMKLYRSSGLAFLQTGVEGNPELEEIGTLTFSFSNCNQGTAAYDTAEDQLGTGSLRIKRLTSLYQMRCSGGISDDTPGNKKPTHLEAILLPIDENSAASGKAKFMERSGRADFRVSVEGLADALYELAVCGTSQGEFTVTDGEGSIGFRAPAIPGKHLLDFFPQDCPIDVLLAGEMVLSTGDSVLAPKAKGAGDDGGDDGTDGEFEVSLDNNGVVPGAKGSASLEQDDDGLRFKVKVMDLPEGEYELFMAGSFVGAFSVTLVNNKTRGEITFSDPQKDGDQLLNFKVLGELLEIYDANDVVVLEAVFPDE